MSYYVSGPPPLCGTVVKLKTHILSLAVDASRDTGGATFVQHNRSVVSFSLAWNCINVNTSDRNVGSRCASMKDNKGRSYACNATTPRHRHRHRQKLQALSTLPSARSFICKRAKINSSF
ncbi:hypothetical protein J6590_021621 [Homalodisca vitripennis]|nr:hypothetical protein J6590_021621 [Homalodisca vitripennis]